MRVAVLGAGPAGLVAAHTAQRMGAKVTIITKEDKPSYISGAQVLHKPISGLDIEQNSFDVQYIKTGTREGYAEKIYGDREAPCSWDLYPEGVMASWSLREVYAHLWDQLYMNMIFSEITHRSVENVSDQFELVFSSLPLPFISQSREEHLFTHQNVWISQVQPESMPLEGGHWIHYLGDDTSVPYRMSYINGYYGIEYSLPPVDETLEYVRVSKPLAVTGGDETRARIVPGNVKLVGRYGKWQKGVLVHHSEQDVEKEMEEWLS